jgi:TM2 domain-containing membrane protein YozV
MSDLKRYVRMKTLCLILALVLFGQFTYLFGEDSLVFHLNPYTSQTDCSDFYEHLQSHDYRNIGVPAYQLYQGNDGIPPLKDPFIAGLLSWFMMGVGQIYANEYWKGSLFIAASLTNKVLLVLLLSHINSKYGSEEQIVSVDWNSFDAGTKVLIVTYIAESLGLRIFSVVDAVRSTQQYNERYEPNDRKSEFSADINGDGVSMGFRYRFND